jgi:ASC-1-like (ASCH) protein
MMEHENRIHHMKLQPSPFEKIKSGEKTIELRLFDEKRQQIKEGDQIVFSQTDTGEILMTRVLKLHRFDTFEALYSNLPLLKCGYTLADVEQADSSDMEQYYSAEEQREYGVVGIELSLTE